MSSACPEGPGVAGSAGSSAAVDLRFQVMWNRLISVVEEQALTLVRTAFSTSVREAGDLSAGVFDTQGRMIAQAVTGTPGHVNTMAAAVGWFIEDIGPHRIYEGDVYITNDPWKGTGHLHDITVVTPSFRGGSLIGYFGCTAHVVDIGGRGFGPDAREVYEEGLRIPVMKLVERGRVNHDLIEMIRANVREPDQVVGDVHSLAACNDTGIDRLHEMLGEFGEESLVGVADFVFERTRAATLAAIAKIPAGTYPNTMTVDGYDTPVTLAVSLNVSAEGVHGDFTGTSPVSGYGVNVPLTYAQAYLTYGLLCALSPGLPNNAASLAPFTVSAPPGCILNARHPDPVAVRHVIGHFVADLCLGAVAPALGDIVPAEGSGALWNFQAGARATQASSAYDSAGFRVSADLADFAVVADVADPANIGPSTRDAADTERAAGTGTSGRRAQPDHRSRSVDSERVTDIGASVNPARPPAEILMFNSGGTGARPGLDGLSATAFPSGVRTMSVEATEQVGPIVVWRKELRPDSGGIGTYRGGLGQVIEIGPAEGYELHFSAMFDRVEHPARGRAGGGDGARGRVYLDDGTPFRAKGKQLVPAGRRLVLELPGGGGWGDPAERPAELAEQDQLQGYVHDPRSS